MEDNFKMNNMDFMTFLNSMNNMGKIKKKKSLKKVSVKDGSKKKANMKNAEDNGELEDICEINEETECECKE